MWECVSPRKKVQLSLPRWKWRGLFDCLRNGTRTNFAYARFEGIFGFRQIARLFPAALLLASVSLCLSRSPQVLAGQSIARVWDERAIAAIRVDTPHPPAQARNLFSLSVCMYDAWAAYDTNGAVGYVYHGKHAAADMAAARQEAISYAAWRLLKERHVYSKTAATTLAADDQLDGHSRIRYQQCLP